MKGKEILSDVAVDCTVDSDISSTLNVLMKEHLQLREDVRMLSETNRESRVVHNYYTTVNNVNNSVNTTTTTTNNNIFISDLGKEDLSFLSDEKRQELVLQMRHGFMSFLKDLHFNPERPQNYNFRILSKKKRLAVIRKNGEWRRGGLRETIEAAIDISKAQFLQPLSDTSYMDSLCQHHEPVVDWCQRFMAKHQSVWRPLMSGVRTELEKVYDDDRKLGVANTHCQ